MYFIVTVGILWKNDEAYLLVCGHNGEYDVINGAWTLILDEKTLEGYPERNSIEYFNSIKLKFDRFTYLTDKIKYPDSSDYNEILNDARELGVENHIDVDVEKENIEGCQRAIQRQKQLDEQYSIPF